MVGIAERAGVQMMVKENWRWSPWYQEMKRTLDEGIVGEPRHLQIVRTCWGSPNPQWQVWREQPYFRELLQAAWFDVGGHFIDTLRFLLGEPLSLSAEMSRISPLMRGEDLAHVTLRFPGCFATCDLSWAERGRPSRAGSDRTRLDGTDGSIEIEDGGRVTFRDNYGGWRVLGGPWPDGDILSHVGSQANFVRSVLGLELPATPAAHNARTLQIVLAAYESAEKDRKVALA
jgi:predicted dehydrogenase